MRICQIVPSLELRHGGPSRSVRGLARAMAGSGERVDLLDDLTRANLRAAPGRIASVEYDEAAGTLAASGEGARAGSELVAFWPTSKHGEPEVGGSGLDDLRSEAGPGGQAWVVGRARGGTWTLSVRSR